MVKFKHGNIGHSRCTVTMSHYPGNNHWQVYKCPQLVSDVTHPSYLITILYLFSMFEHCEINLGVKFRLMRRNLWIAENSFLLYCLPADVTGIKSVTNGAFEALNGKHYTTMSRNFGIGCANNVITLQFDRCTQSYFLPVILLSPDNSPDDLPFCE